MTMHQNGRQREFLMIIVTNENTTVGMEKPEPEIRASLWTWDADEIFVGSLLETNLRVQSQHGIKITLKEVTPI